MNNKQEISYIEEIKNLLVDHYTNVINIGNEINLFIKENDPSFDKLKNFKIDSSKLSDNQTYFVSKNILSEKSDIQFPLLGRTATFDNSHYLLITSGKYLDNSENSDDSRNFMFLS